MERLDQHLQGEDIAFPITSKLSPGAGAPLILDKTRRPQKPALLIGNGLRPRSLGPFLFSASLKLSSLLLLTRLRAKADRRRGNTYVKCDL